MIQRILTNTIVLALVLMVCGVGPAEARYRYGRYGGGAADRGFYVVVEGLSTNPRNADLVVATTEIIQDYGGGTNYVSPVIPGWDNDVAGRLGVGYQWASGNKLALTVWSFETSTNSVGNGPTGGNLHFAVGPPIYTAGGYVGAFGSPGYHEMNSEITAQTADLAWAREHELNESFSVEWSAGLRYAKYEETMLGFYDDVDSIASAFGLVRYSAAKTVEGEMIGVKVAARGTYRITQSFWVGTGLGFSFLDGEVTGASMLSPIGLTNASTEPTGFASIKDDGRSGDILDFDLIFGWRSASDRLRIWLGWEQSTWNEIVDDLVRNLPGTTAPLRDRDSVAISGYKLGVYFRF
jgi:hypothetical protein